MLLSSLAVKVPAESKSRAISWSLDDDIAGLTSRLHPPPRAWRRASEALAMEARSGNRYGVEFAVIPCFWQAASFLVV